ncbi:MAG: hypothetical protein FJZ47_20960, partial [Candidatus Tectomicrobia bacterium]|nr:hypothetical protein [Candidatus Tectomicrobia bacterium]
MSRDHPVSLDRLLVVCLCLWGSLVGLPWLGQAQQLPTPGVLPSTTTPSPGLRTDPGGQSPAGTRRPSASGLPSSLTTAPVPSPQPATALPPAVPATGVAPRAPVSAEPAEAATVLPPQPGVPEELSAIERLIAGNTPDPNTFLRQFGYDLFTRPPTTFAPVTDVPVGPEYVLGPGDNLNIILWGGVQESYQLEVDRNGAIAFPRLGVVQVWGLTIEQAQRLLQQRFSEFYTDFRMAVTLGRLRTILVYVVGEVRQPGAYTVSSLSTIINALFASGGPTKNGSLRRIQLVRQGRPAHTLDLYDLLLQGNKGQDKALQSGDTILVPLIGPVAGVAGNVKRPAIYELEAGATLQRLLDLAGGATALGYLQRVQVERAVANERKMVADFDLSGARPKVAAADVWKTRVTDGDLVRIFSIL